MPSFLPRGVLEVGSDLRLRNMVEDAIGQIRLPTMLEDGISQIRSMADASSIQTTRMDTDFRVPDLRQTMGAEGYGVDDPLPGASRMTANVGTGTPTAFSGRPQAMPTSTVSFQGGKNPEGQQRVYQTALASGLDDEGARVLAAVTETEGGWGGAVGDQGQSHGVYEFHERGQMPGFKAWLQQQGIQGDPYQLAYDPEVATRYAATTYLGQAVREGRAQGLTGAELATYVQRHGQRSVAPEKTGENYRRLYATTAPSAEPAPTQYRPGTESASGPIRVVPGAKANSYWTSGGTHGGAPAADIFAELGSPILAPVGGTMRAFSAPLGGNAAILHGDDGRFYYFAHAHGPMTSGRVQPGQQIGQVGQSGNARGTDPHLHYAIASDPSVFDRKNGSGDIEGEAYWRTPDGQVHSTNDGHNHGDPRQSLNAGAPQPAATPSQQAPAGGADPTAGGGLPPTVAQKWRSQFGDDPTPEEVEQLRMLGVVA